MTTTTDIRISFDQDPPVYEPGQTISGDISLTDYQLVALKKVEVSVLWHTMGRGTEDSGVIYFKSYGPETAISLPMSIPFSTKLPALPVSYEGRLLKIHWVVRVRVFPQRGRSFGAETRFSVKSTQPEGSRDPYSTDW